MRQLLILLVVVLLSACGRAPGGAAGNSDTGSSSVASLSSLPTPEAFNLAKGETKTLSVTITRKDAALARLELSTQVGPLGLTISPSSYMLTFEEGGPNTQTVEFSVSVEPSITNPKPDFYIYGKALDERGRSIGSGTLRLKYQWSL